MELQPCQSLTPGVCVLADFPLPILYIHSFQGFVFSLSEGRVVFLHMPSGECPAYKNVRTYLWEFIVFLVLPAMTDAEGRQYQTGIKSDLSPSSFGNQLFGKGAVSLSRFNSLEQIYPS